MPRAGSRRRSACARPWLLGAGVVLFGLAVQTDIPEPARAVETQLRSPLRLPATGAAGRPELGDGPKAPDFTAVRLAGGEPFKLSTAAASRWC
jgi:hypothetical protein